MNNSVNQVENIKTKHKIKILLPLYTLPSVPLVHSRIFEALLPKLEEKYDVELNCFVYLPDRISTKLEGYKILDIHDFSNAVELIRNIRPDLVYGHMAPALDPQFAVPLAAKFLNVPVLSGVWSNRWIKNRKSKKIFSYFMRFFENQVPFETNKNKKTFLRRGKFFIYKTLFLYKTLRAMRFSRFESFSKLCEISKQFFVDAHSSTGRYDPKYVSDLHWLENDSMKNEMSRYGFKKDTLIVTGNPLYDIPIKRIQNFKSQHRINKKIQVLFATSTVVEHGIWSKQQRDTAVENIIKNISLQKDLISLKIKIGPLEDYSKYASIVNNIDKNIPIYQDGDFLDYLEETDLVISYSGVTSVAIFALLAKKPLVITNFFNMKGDKLFDEKLVLNCENPSQLVDLIKNGVENNPATNQKIEKFMSDFFFKTDGKASDRLSEAIIDLLERRKRKK